MLKTNGEPTGVGTDSHQTLMALHEPWVMLRLAAYAMDAMRVLDRLQHHADRSKSFDQSISAICPDWRNPGCIDDPADLITVVMSQATQKMSDTLRDL